MVVRLLSRWYHSSNVTCLSAVRCETRRLPYLAIPMMWQGLPVSSAALTSMVLLAIQVIVVVVLVRVFLDRHDMLDVFYSYRRLFSRRSV